MYINQIHPIPIRRDLYFTLIYSPLKRKRYTHSPPAVCYCSTATTSPTKSPNPPVSQLWAMHTNNARWSSVGGCFDWFELERVYHPLLLPFRPFQTHPPFGIVIELVVVVCYYDWLRIASRRIGNLPSAAGVASPQWINSVMMAGIARILWFPPFSTGRGRLIGTAICWIGVKWEHASLD